MHTNPLPTPLEKHPPLRLRTCWISRFATAIGFSWHFWDLQHPRASPGNQPPLTLSILQMFLPHTQEVMNMKLPVFFRKKGLHLVPDRLGPEREGEERG